MFAFFALLACPAWDAGAARLEVLEVPGVTLRENPLGDPARRRLALFLPSRAASGTRTSIVIYLPGWGGSSEEAIAQGAGSWFGSVVDELAGAGFPTRLAVVDGRSRYGGSQFLNSAATGNYADYVADEILPLLIANAGRTNEEAPFCIVAGHSSGAYGALMLAIARHADFPAVVALSPDSDFEVTHKPIVQQPAVRRVTPQALELATAPAGQARLPEDGLALLVMGLCANYAPRAGEPRRFEWLYDERGEWRADAWARWLELDPLTVVRRRKDAFSSTQRIYLDGAEHDEFGANIGARKIHGVLAQRGAAAAFYESPGHHSDGLPARLNRGLSWILSERAKK